MADPVAQNNAESVAASGAQSTAASPAPVSSASAPAVTLSSVTPPPSVSVADNPAQNAENKSSGAPVTPDASLISPVRPTSAHQASAASTSSADVPVQWPTARPHVASDSDPLPDDDDERGRDRDIDFNDTPPPSKRVASSNTIQSPPQQVSRPQSVSYPSAEPAPQPDPSAASVQQQPAAPHKSIFQRVTSVFRSNTYAFVGGSMYGALRGGTLGLATWAVLFAFVGPAFAGVAMLAAVAAPAAAVLALYHGYQSVKQNEARNAQMAPPAAQSSKSGTATGLSPEEVREGQLVLDAEERPRYNFTHMFKPHRFEGSWVERHHRESEALAPEHHHRH